MAETLTLDATAREGTGKGAARTARRAGMVPGVIYGGNTSPTAINVKFSELLKNLKAGQFMSQLLNVRVDGDDHRVICRAVQRDVVKDLPIHVDFLRLTERSRVNLQIPVEFINHEECPGLKRGGTMTIVRPLVELRVTAGNIPENLTVDLSGLEVGDVVTISNIEMPEGSRPVISDRDFVVANITAPSSLKSEDEEDEEAVEEVTEEEGGEE